jgi:penicillin-binding protein 2
MGLGFRRKIRNIFKKPDTEIAPDEIFLDSSNLPDFDRNQFEGRIEKPISKKTITKLGFFFVFIFVVMISKVWILQIEEGEAYTIQSELNRLRHGLIFSERGVILDRNGVELAWNIPSESDFFARRKYIEEGGFSHLLGYVSYPLKDSSGVYYQPDYIGIEGVESEYNELLSGENGLKIIETDALGNIESEGVIRPPKDGTSITLTVDSELQTALHEILGKISKESRFVGGAGVVMDIKNGEILALTSYPEYDSNVLSEGGPEDEIDSYVGNSGKPFLNRATTGLYTPGSIVKPFVAIGALNEGIIKPETKILSTGSLILPNPFDEDKPSIFKDWKAHGYTNMREAIAVSSDVYFYEIGGGFEDQKGLGIENIERYMRIFGIGNATNIDLPSEAVGVIPNPDWKQENFPGDPWRIGNTYHTSIGQYGFQLTPLQAVRATGAIASEGVLVEPHVLKIHEGGVIKKNIPISKDYFTIAKEGMRLAVTEGTAIGLWRPEVDVAAKTGTAQVGVKNEYVNSWIIGFFPYDKPQYAFAILMERAPAGTLVGSVAAARDMFDWIVENKPEYVGQKVEGI